MFNAQQEPWYQILDKEKKNYKKSSFLLFEQLKLKKREEKRKKNEMKEFKMPFA